MLLLARSLVRGKITEVMGSCLEADLVGCRKISTILAMLA